MRASRHDLARLLATTIKVVESRNTIPILSTVRLVADGGKLTATATDLDIEISGSVEAEGPLEVCVGAKLLAAVVNKAAGDEITIEPTDAGVVVRSGRNRTNLQTLPVDDFPTMAAGEWTAEFTTDLAALFAPCQFAVSTEETRYYLNGVHMHVDGGKLVAVATDGHRLARNYGPTAPDFKGIIVPRKTVGILPKGEITVRLSETKIQFASPDVTITSKLIDGTFPDYQRVIPSGNDKRLVIDRQSFAAAVDRVSTISSERGRAVKLSIADGQLTLAVNNPDSGSATEELAADYSSEPIDIGFNARYLLDVAAQLSGGNAEFMLADAGSPTLIHDTGDADTLYVLMPMRV